MDGGDSYLQTLQVATVTKVLGRMILKVGDGPVKGSFHAASASSVHNAKVMSSRGWF